MKKFLRPVLVSLVLLAGCGGGGGGGGGGGDTPTDTPTASFTINPGAPKAGDTVTFTPTASSHNGPITGYQWNFGDASATASGQTVTHTYSTAGSYTVTLTVKDSKNATFVATQAVRVWAVGSDFIAKQISVGPHRTCAIDSSGHAYCWGGNVCGLLGDGSATNSAIPVAVRTDGVLAGKTIKQITAGGAHTCVIASDDRVYCWGNNINGALGNNGPEDCGDGQPVPVADPLANKTIKQIAAGDAHTCAIDSDNTVYCWGFDLALHSAVPVAVDTTSGVLSGKTIQQIAAGGHVTCVIANGQAYCWGNGYDFGNVVPRAYTALSSLVPVAIDIFGTLADKTIQQISVSNTGGHICAVADGRGYCWGNSYLGNNPATDSTDPPGAVRTDGVLAGKTMKQISSGMNYSCAIADTQAYCWGENSFGQLGDNSTTTRLVPVVVNTSGVLTGKTMQQIAAGQYHTCAIDSGGQVYCWGRNTSGQLGNGSTTNSSVPVTVVSP